MSPEFAEYIDIGARIGRGQAFGMVANQSLACQAACLRGIREGEQYKVLGISWEEFCQQYMGMSKRHADDIIHNLEEFGQAYFRLVEIIRVSPETYREIAGKIDDGAIEIDGHKIPIAPENAPRIRTAIQTLRQQLRDAKKRTVAALAIPSLQRVLNQGLREMRIASEQDLSPEDRNALAEIAGQAILELNKLCDRLQA